MPKLEKGGPPESRPIPKILSLQDNPDIAGNLEFRQAPSLLEVQIFALARRCAISAPMAEALAPLIYGSWRS